MTKPEGPAQEPQHDQDCGCAKCFVAAEGKYAWRIGRKVPTNVYEGDRPVCQCQTALDAKKIVAAVNAAMRQVPATPAPSQPAVTNRFCTRCGKLNDHTHEPPTRDRHDRPAFTGCCGTPTTGLSYVNPQHRADCPLRNAPSQPAAREPWMEAAMEEIALLYIRSAVTKEQVDGVAVIARHYAQQTASLREANARLAADLDAALKAGKE